MYTDTYTDIYMLSLIFIYFYFIIIFENYYAYCLNIIYTPNFTILEPISRNLTNNVFIGSHINDHY